MPAVLILTIVFFIIVPLRPVEASEVCINCGTVKGKISVWRTRIRTEGPKNEKNVVIYLEDSSGEKYSDFNETVYMDQKNLIFSPHILPVRRGASVIFLNNDSVDHNVYLLFEKNGATLDLGTWGQGKTTEYLFSDGGVAIVLCKLHLEMAAYIITLNNPYFHLAAIDGDTQSGDYVIKDVPAGIYTISAWHKKLKMKHKQTQIVVEKDKITRYDITITKSKYVN